MSDNPLGQSAPTSRFDEAAAQWDNNPVRVALARSISSMTMHHVQDVPLVLRRLAAILKPGGWLAVADLDAEDGSFHGDAHEVFHQGFERERIGSWFQDAGLTRVRVTDARQVSKPDARDRVRVYPVFLASGRKD